jgi:hypothetical protein
VRADELSCGSQRRLWPLRTHSTGDRIVVGSRDGTRAKSAVPRVARLAEARKVEDADAAVRDQIAREQVRDNQTRGLAKESS